MAEAFQLLFPKDFEITDQSGAVRKFIISKFPAVAGREIVAKYPVSALPLVGDYTVSEETMLKLMSFVAVELEGGKGQRLGSRALVDNHCGDWETLGKIEVEMMKYNCSFFRDGRALSFFDELAQKILAKISEISTPSSASSSPAEKPALTS